MTTHVSHVSQESLLRQAVLNTSQSIELLREAVSNSVDAEARSIDIKLTNAGGEIWNIVIQDDGNGMEERHMRAFHAATEVKDYPQTAIGEKGLGSKTAFVARDIVIESRRHSDPTVVLVGKMSSPLASLESGALPSYTIEKDPPGHSPAISTKGTRVTLTGVHLASFNGKKTSEGREVAARVMRLSPQHVAQRELKPPRGARPSVISMERERWRHPTSLARGGDEHTDGDTRPLAGFLPGSAGRPKPDRRTDFRRGRAELEALL